MPSIAELLRAASRTFAVGIELLPAPLREQVRISYLLLRVSDYLEDHPTMAPGRKATLLRTWEEVLAGHGDVAEIERAVADDDVGPDALVARRASQVIAAFDDLAPAVRLVIASYVRESTRGMARWVERGPLFETESDLDDYMHEVAGRVGYLLTDLFALHSAALARRRERMLPQGREFGLALQTVNVIRGLHADRERGWVFVPRSYLEEAGVTARELFERPGSAGAVRVLDRLVAKAERHFAGARAYVRLIPWHHYGIRLFCVLPLLFGVRTLAVSRSNPKVFVEETKITREEVAGIIRRSRLLGCSDLWVEWYSRKLASAPLHPGAQLPPHALQNPTSSNR